MRTYRLIIQIAATFVGTIIGAGFATGKEIVQFFTQYGAWGTLGILISGILFIFVGSKLMILAGHVGARSYKDLNIYLFGKTVGSLFNGLNFLVLLGTTAVMLSGAGAVFHEQLGWPWQAGLLMTLGLCYLSLLKGLNGVMTVNVIVVPIMILFTLFLALVRLPHMTVASVFPSGPLQISWLISALTYVSFNLMAAQAVLVPLGGDIRDPDIVRRGGVLGGAVFTVLLLASHFVLSGAPSAAYFQIPIAEIVKSFGALIHVLFILVIFGEIFTTFMGNIYGLKRHLSQLIPVHEQLLMVGLFAFTFVISQIGYGPLLSHLYPFYGYLGLVFTFLILLKKKAS